MESIVSLCELSPGEAGVIAELRTEGALARRLRDLGFSAGTRAACLGRAPAGDPTAYLVRGAVLALRRSDAAAILVRPLEGRKAPWA